MESARVKAYAKLNLTLEITGVQNGFHNIESLVCSVDIFDIIKLKKRGDSLVTVEMHGQGSESIPFESNNAARAAEEYIRSFGTCGADIKIYKNIPMGAGMGGSSADAAGVLRGMNALYGAASERGLKGIADGLGSDTGYMLTGGFAHLSGRGEEVRQIDCATRLDFLLLFPKTGVSTAECYKLYDVLKAPKNRVDGAAEALMSGDKDALGASLFNDLYPPAAVLNEQVRAAYEALKGFSPLGVNMTGSGSCVYALFENNEFCNWAKSRYRGKMRCEVVKTLVPKI